MFQLLAKHYRKLVQIIDFHMIILLLRGWSDESLSVDVYEMFYSL
jgi:hypothetical protein